MDAIVLDVRLLNVRWSRFIAASKIDNRDNSSLPESVVARCRRCHSPLWTVPSFVVTFCSPIIAWFVTAQKRVRILLTGSPLSLVNSRACKSSSESGVRIMKKPHITTVKFKDVSFLRAPLDSNRSAIKFPNGPNSKFHQILCRILTTSE